jgi:hypothetical protein
VSPTWAEVVERDYAPRADDRLVIDTAVMALEESVATLRGRLREA